MKTAITLTKKMLKTAPLLATLLCCVAHAQQTQAQAQGDPAVAAARQAFVERMVTEHKFDRATLTANLGAAEINQKILDAISKPAERVVPWHEYRNIFVTDKRIAAGVQFWQENAASIDRISKEYGVAPEMILGIIGVETFFGQITGRYRVIDALSTLAFAYPPRAKFFASELEAFLLLTREEDLDVFAPLGSYAGAMGRGQFIPSSFRAYAVDANADGHRDIWTNWEDVLGSVANYFKKHGWQTGQPVADPAMRPAKWTGPEPKTALELENTVGELHKLGYEFMTTQPANAQATVIALEAADGGSEFWIGYHNFRVITRYNRSPKYALAAYQLSQAIREGYLAANAGTAQ